ncbi:hypothetical protein LMJF_12_1210 [Leishmania major strain Friedlin]|uniref:Uncharacterized protein n=1 Tax=Leishmania major TaxID=5664 RepID=Q4QGG8_LEIMA|nr:hypothetical protein LMJF_12_1210 [Leishmania major strain Friedlin]CAG9570521.1 hypothetical_protein_-_conserved [Leishmania major strain Friedlin]CAJ03070.1 hypothetical protein LMJF_12_1210 [Leishmania major strain Friedlin]|eukprot:XP_001681730.1 hypothetical protein LMJF_12_1210 [Leishmania major strain Friedlin]
MSHPYATNEPLHGAGDDAEHAVSNVVSPLSGAAPPVAAMTPSPEEHADGSDNAHPAASSCTVEKHTLCDNTQVIHGSDQDDIATAVSHSPDVSSPSSSSCSAESSMPPSWLPSRSSSCSSATSSSVICASDCSSCSSGNADLVADGASSPESGHSHHLHQGHRHRHRRHHRQNSSRHCSDDRHVTHGEVDRRVGTTASRRVQTSEHTRFTSVLAGGRRGSDRDGPGAATAVSCGRIDGDVDGGSSCTQDVAWWRSFAAAAKVTGAVSTATCDVHPYCCAPHSPQFPLQRQQHAAGVDPACRDVATTPQAAATQRLSIISPFVATVSGTLFASPTPLPPPHPRRSSSARIVTSNAFITHITGGVPRSSESLFTGKGSGGRFASTAMDGSVQMHPSRSVGCVARHAQCGTLRRSFSFTSGVPPVSASSYEVPPFSTSRAASPIAAANAAIGAPRTSLTGERQHERTASVASSVYSASSSARPSVPLPPSHVGIASNMMAAVWVDLPLSQSGSRSATPLNSSDAYAPPRRRRTTPRRCSRPQSPATSTLAASGASSLDGAGYMSSATGGAPISARRLLVTVSTQTDNDRITVEGCTTPVSLPRHLYCKSSSTSPYAAKVGGGEHCGYAAHQYNLNGPFERDGAALTAAASVSSTSAEVSPRSLLASAAEIRLDDHVAQAVLDTDAARCVQQHTTGDDMPAAPPNAPTSLSTDVATKGNHLSEGDSRSSASAEPPGTMYVYQTLCVDVPPLQGGTKAAAAAVNTSAATEAGTDSTAGILAPPATFSLPTSFVTQLRGVVPPALPQSEAGAPPAGGVPQPTTTAAISDEAGAHSTLKAAGGEGRRGAARGTGSVGCGETASVEEAGDAPYPQPLPPSRRDEVWRLRAELAEMRHQYAQVVRQLRQMQESAVAAGPAAGSRQSAAAAAALNAGHRVATEAVLITNSPPLPAASPPSSLRSVAIQNRSGAPENPLVESASSVSSNSDNSGDAATVTLDRVRAALQRARERATN